MKTLKIESLQKGWSDKDEMMLHACFQLLKDCVEKEKLFEHSWKFVKSKNGKIIKELYEWWQTRNSEEFILSINDWEHQYDFDTKQLIKLMKVRSYLWT
jgi:hypothetical protein